MNIQFHTEHISLSEKQKAYVEEKISTLKKYGDRLSDEAVQVKVHIERNERLGQSEKISMKVSMAVPQANFRAEVEALTVEEGADKIHDKLLRQIERYKAKHMVNEKISSAELAMMMERGHGRIVDGKDLRINKRKLFTDLLPMTEEEAIAQMDMLGHNFFIFVNSVTDKYNIVYKRNDAEGFGLVELEHSEGVLNYNKS